MDYLYGTEKVLKDNISFTNKTIMILDCIPIICFPPLGLFVDIIVDQYFGQTQLQLTTKSLNSAIILFIESKSVSPFVRKH